jgi:hypothetical protein
MAETVSPPSTGAGWGLGERLKLPALPKGELNGVDADRELINRRDPPSASCLGGATARGVSAGLSVGDAAAAGAVSLGLSVGDAAAAGTVSIGLSVGRVVATGASRGEVSPGVPTGNDVPASRQATNAAAAITKKSTASLSRPKPVITSSWPAKSIPQGSWKPG